MLIDLEYIHPCWVIESVEKVEGAKVRLVSALHLDKVYDEGLYELEASDIDKLVEVVSRNPLVKRVQVLQKTRDWALAHIVSKHDSLVVAKLMRTKSVPLLPSLTQVDRDFVTLLVPSDLELKNVSSLLKDDIEYWVRSKKYLENPLPSSLFNSKDFLKFKLVTEHLPVKQREAFLLATRKGYYSTPRKTSVEELAHIMDVSPSTLAEHLRKAEARLLPLIGGILAKLPSETGF
jgi:predicted DNA binding protein